MRKNEDYILPFLWLKGEDEEAVREEICQIASCGIGAFCVESRPHPDFLGPGWWKTMDLVLAEAKKHDMRVWILDDAHFPTGYAAGAYEEREREKAKWYLVERHVDVIGSGVEQAIFMQPFLGRDGHLLAAVAYPKPDQQTTAVQLEGAVECTAKITDGILYLTLPEGYWRVFFFYRTQQGGGRERYMNLIDEESVKVLLDTVYEPHYAHYAAEFGQTIAGFFSDEPELGNVPGYGFEEKLGKADVRLPWSEELAKSLKKRWGGAWPQALVGLWYEAGKHTKEYRNGYIDEVTRLVGKCFTGQIRSWCEAHGVEYIGHILEDAGSHTRLGCGCGHYFREQSGQHMSGVDVVHFQIMPGFREPVHRWIAGEEDGEFFHFGLAKLGASAAHLDPQKKGRALCEIFGNYGWGFGVSDMKWLVDHMLVRGINHFVPHAFSMTFPDPDCPPHFYARGRNPQFEAFKVLMKYTDRMCRVLSDGIHQADAAILYHAQAEWSGGSTMPFHKPGRMLMEAQLDYDVISEDDLWRATADGGRMRIGEVTYPALILPYFQWIDGKSAQKAGELAEKGVPVYCIDALPEGLIVGEELPKVFQDSVRVVPLEQIAGCFAAASHIEKKVPYLRLYRYRKAGELIYLWMNEDPLHALETEVRLPEETGEWVEYDGMEDVFGRIPIRQKKALLRLESGQTRTWICLPEKQKTGFSPAAEIRTETLACAWRIELKGYDEEGFHEWKTLAPGEAFPNINGAENLPRFSGTIAYETEYQIDTPFWDITLILPAFCDTARVLINGQDAGFCFRGMTEKRIGDSVVPGRNVLRIEVTNTLFWSLRDPVSTHHPMGPTGLLAAPRLRFARRILSLHDEPAWKEKASAWFHEKWGVPQEEYAKSMEECIRGGQAVPQWYILPYQGEIIAGVGVIENDFHDRKDLTPNVCALFVEKEWRNRGIAGQLLAHVTEDMHQKGVDTLYLITDHTSFYERYGWQFLCMVQEEDGNSIRMYTHQVTD